MSLHDSLPDDFLSARKVSSTKEIIRMIFKYLTSSDNTVNARVCKAWSHEALELIWDHVTAKTVFSLLAKFEQLGSGMLGFTRRISHNDWARFDLYSGRIRSLFIDVCDDKIDSSVWREISYGRPRTEILPRLEAVSGVSGSFMTSLFFCHSSVTRVSISFTRTDVTPDNFIPALSYLPTKTPRLSTFSVYGHDAALSPESQLHFESTVAMLTSIRTLRIPGHWLTPKAMDALPLLCLRDICIVSLPPPLESADASLPCKELIYRLCCGRPQLESLSLSASCIQPRMDFEAIRPILCLSRLSRLSLDGLYYSDLDTPHLITIFQSLPTLTFFWLLSLYDNEPLDPPPLLRISSLAAIITFCNNLEELAIEMDALSESPPESDDGLCFAKLSRLRVGKSPISQPISVARFLSGILPQDCTLQFQYFFGSEGKTNGWETVTNVLPEFFLARSSERKRLAKNG